MGNKVYVGNINYDTTEDSLRELFTEYGEVQSVRIITDRFTGFSKGFAFVEMPDANEAKEAIENLNETEIAGRLVTVNEARPRSDRPRRGSGRRDRW